LIEPANIRTIFMGTPEFALPTLKGLIDYGVDLKAVYTQPDRPSGRGKRLSPPPVKSLAEEHAIAVRQPQRLRATEAVEALRALDPDLIIVIAYGQILPQSILDIPRFGCINVHASLLPQYRGAAPINKAIIEGETETGITTMLMEAGLDTGDMLVKKSTSIGPEETAGELHNRLALLGRETLIETLDRLRAGTLEPEPQDDDRSSYAPMLKKEDGRIDWSRSAREIHNQIRGLDPWPGAYTFLDGTMLKLFRTSPENGPSANPGEIVSSETGGIRVACGDGILRIRELQISGKKRLAASEFLRGRSLSPGARLET